MLRFLQWEILLFIGDDMAVKMADMKIESIPIECLTPYPKNAKKHDQRQIRSVAESIKQYGFVQPLVIDRDAVVVIGHCRLLAAKKLGMGKVPCVRVDDLAPEQVNALRLVDNKSNESEWDMDLLAEELPGLDLSAFDFDFGIWVEEDSESEECPKLTENTLEEYKHIHYLVTIDVNEHDKIAPIIEALIEAGADVEYTKNNY